MFESSTIKYKDKKRRDYFMLVLLFCEEIVPKIKVKGSLNYMAILILDFSAINLAFKTVNVSIQIPIFCFPNLFDDKYYPNKTRNWNETDAIDQGFDILLSGIMFL